MTEPRRLTDHETVLVVDALRQDIVAAREATAAAEQRLTGLRETLDELIHAVEVAHRDCESSHVCFDVEEARALHRARHRRALSAASGETP